mgnify:CR=1 FL=1
MSTTGIHRWSTGHLRTAKACFEFAISCAPDDAIGLVGLSALLDMHPELGPVVSSTLLCETLTRQAAAAPPASKEVCVRRLMKEMSTCANSATHRFVQAMLGLVYAVCNLNPSAARLHLLTAAAEAVWAPDEESGSDAGATARISDGIAGGGGAVGGLHGRALCLDGAANGNDNNDNDEIDDDDVVYDEADSDGMEEEDDELASGSDTSDDEEAAKAGGLAPGAAAAKRKRKQRNSSDTNRKEGKTKGEKAKGKGGKSKIKGWMSAGRRKARADASTSSSSTSSSSNSSAENERRGNATTTTAAAAAVASVAVEGPASALRHKLDGRAVCVEDHRRSNVLALSVLAKAAVSGLYGFPKSLGKACELALRAAMMGDASSQFLLGVVAAEGALGTGSSQRMETAAVCVVHLFRCVGCAELRAHILWIFKAYWVEETSHPKRHLGHLERHSQTGICSAV